MKRQFQHYNNLKHVSQLALLITVVLTCVIGSATTLTAADESPQLMFVQCSDDRSAGDSEASLIASRIRT